MTNAVLGDTHIASHQRRTAEVLHHTNFDAFVREKNGVKKLDLSVRGAKCGGCISKIERAIRTQNGVTSARLNLSNGELNIIADDTFSANDVARVVTDLGYGVSAQSASKAAAHQKAEESHLLVAMGVAGFAAANIMLLSVSVWGGATEMGEQTRQVFHGISGLIAFPVIVFSGRHFFSSAWSALKHRNMNMDVPVSLAIWLAFGVSVWETISGGQHAYFDACVMLLFFLLIGRFLDARLRRRAFAAARELAALRNRTVSRITPRGIHTVQTDDIKPGERILVAPGEQTAIDIEVVAGGSEIDESLVTGESLPRFAGIGSTVYSGSVNIGAAIEGVAISAAADSLLADITNMLEAGEQRRSTYRKIADHAVSLYVPFVHTTALLAFAAWLIIGASIEDAVLVAASTLIITCPCALALAAPVAQMVAAGRLFKLGAFLKSGDALERLAAIDHIVFDKTGTLTLGMPKWIPTSKARDNLHDAAEMARASRHPLSRALAAAAGPGKTAKGVEEHAGKGLRTWTNTQEHRLGSADWVGAGEHLKQDGPVLWYRSGDAHPVAFEFEDAPQIGAEKAVKELSAMGFELEILSGDRSNAVEKMACLVGIPHWTSAASPQEKAGRLEHLAGKGKRVLMIGDGLNDAAALSLAHAALAPGGAVDISQASADVVFSGGLKTIPQILAVAQAAKQTMLQNFALAAAYNLVAVPIAVTGNVTPLIAAIAMSVSSLIVTLNAIRRR
ncbi:MAG: heavy metal translocating P-type ATPase [Pseudomonadota bacterium]